MRFLRETFRNIFLIRNNNTTKILALSSDPDFTSFMSRFFTLW